MNSEWVQIETNLLLILFRLFQILQTGFDPGASAEPRKRKLDVTTRSVVMSQLSIGIILGQPANLTKEIHVTGLAIDELYKFKIIIWGRVRGFKIYWTNFSLLRRNVSGSP